jgi:hypothetical protein
MRTMKGKKISAVVLPRASVKINGK